MSTKRYLIHKICQEANIKWLDKTSIGFSKRQLEQLALYLESTNKEVSKLREAFRGDKNNAI